MSKRGRPQHVAKEVVLQLCREGKRPCDIALSVGLSRQRVGQILKEAGDAGWVTPVRPLSYKAKSALKMRAWVNEQEARQALIQHRTLKDAAAAVGVTPGGLLKRLRRAGVDVEQVLKRFEAIQRAETIAALAQSSNLSEASRKLGLTPPGVRYRLERFELNPDSLSA